MIAAKASMKERQQLPLHFTFTPWAREALVFVQQTATADQQTTISGLLAIMDELRNKWLANNFSTDWKIELSYDDLGTFIEAVRCKHDWYIKQIAETPETEEDLRSDLINDSAEMKSLLEYLMRQKQQWPK
jgi:hypothetical protein